MLCGKSVVAFFALLGASVSAAPTIADTIDTFTVSGRGFTRPIAIQDAAEAAIEKVLRRYVPPAEFDANLDVIEDQILVKHDRYLTSFRILDEAKADDGATEITAEASVNIGKFVTSLRNLNIATRLISPGPNQAVEGRRRVDR